MEIGLPFEEMDSSHGDVDHLHVLYSHSLSMYIARTPRQALTLSTVIDRVRNISAVNVLRVVWLVAVVWYELGVFFSTVGNCTWPDKEFAFGGDAGRGQGSAPRPVHVLLVADPQVLDGRSYPDRPRWLGALTQVVVDLNLRKSWWAIRRLLLTRHDATSNDDDDAVVFLGDMMDNGRNAYGDAEYNEYYNRFKSIFSTDSSTKVYYIPGNHDIGLGTSRTFSPQSRARYTTHFSPLNYKISLANHTLVMLDAPGVVEEDYRRSAAGQNFENWTPPAGGVIDFVNNFASVGTEEPVVLFSHIPLFRPDTAPCGPFRERGTIRRGVGFGYQNTLGRQTSEYILKNVRPSVIFSGDDHDYCEYTHSIPLVSEGPEPKIEYVREVTVKSLSMVMGVRNPGFQLLSLADPARLAPGSPSHADALCILPDQLAIYVSRYLPLFLLSLCVLAVSLFWRLHERGRYDGPYNLDVDPGDASSMPQTSPESTFAGPLSTARMPNTSASGGAGLAPTYRASSATFPTTPYTPDFTVPSANNPTLDERVVTRGVLSVPPAGLAVFPGDVELGYVPHDDYEEDEESQYAERRIPNDTFYAPTIGRTPRRRRLAWSWTFVMRGRRRRVTVGVPPLLEQAFSKLLHLCRRGGDRERVGTRRGRKESHRIAGRESAIGIFANDLRGAAWPPVLVFALINFLVLR